MLSIQNIKIQSIDGQLTVSVRVDTVTNISQNLSLLTINFKGTNWKTLLPEEPILEFPIDPTASRYYFERTFAILSRLHTNCFLDPKIWTEIEPKLRTIDFKQLAGSNTELNLYTAPVAVETNKHDKNAEVVKEPHNTLEINIHDESAMQKHVKVTGATSGTVKVSFGGASNSLFFKGLQGDKITITQTIDPDDLFNVSDHAPK